MQSHTQESNDPPSDECVVSLTDPRLVRRFERIVAAKCRAPGQSIPQMSATWAEVKATYRFLGLLG